MIRTKMCLCMGMLFGILTTKGHAQLTVPPLATSDSACSVRPISAGEVSHYIAVKGAQLELASLTQPHYPKDSILAAVSTSAAHWLAQLQKTPISGTQLDPAARVGVVAGNERYAKDQIAKRLATSGLSLADRAFTYLTAVQAFADPYYPERLPIAETYLAQLNALGDSAAHWQFMAQVALAKAYYLLGQSADVTRHGISAMALVRALPFMDRTLLFPKNGSDPIYTITVEALTGQPEGRAKIEMLNTWLRAAVTPSPELIAVDSAFYWLGQFYQRTLERRLTVNALLGKQGQPIVSNYWLNWRSQEVRQDSTVRPVSDGKIRILEVGSYGCAPCLLALGGLQRLQQTFPATDMVYVTFTQGHWANRLVEPEEEVTHLRDYFRNTAHVTFPVAIWKAKLVLNEDGGMTPENYGPNVKNYLLLSKPMLWVLDGAGTIRRIFLGYSRDTEMQIAQTIQFLTSEAAAVSATPSRIHNP